jgi:hypothetical protein
MPQASPDVALLAAGWERNAQTDEYRPVGAADWLSHDAARALAFPPFETELERMPPEATIIGLLTEILAAVKRIEAKL